MLTGFNTYLDEIDIEFWTNLCLESGILKRFAKGEEFITCGKVARYVGLIKEGSLKYVAHNAAGHEKVIGLETVGGFAASFPFCLHNLPSVCSVVVNTDSEIYCLSVAKIKEKIKTDADAKEKIDNCLAAVFYNIYNRYIDLHTLSPKERFEQLMNRCPKLFEIFMLKDIASYLNITPTHLSRLKNS